MNLEFPELSGGFDASYKPSPGYTDSMTLTESSLEIEDTIDHRRKHLRKDMKTATAGEVIGHSRFRFLAK
jgi:hypothetical protein